MPITTKVVSSNPVHGGVYSIQHYVIKFVSDDLGQVGGMFSPGTPVYWPPEYNWNIVEIDIKHYKPINHPIYFCPFWYLLQLEPTFLLINNIFLSFINITKCISVLTQF